MKYVTQELELNLPEPFQDRSVNALLLGSKQPPDFNLVISRDVIPQGAVLDEIVRKQMKSIASAQENFKELQPATRRMVSKVDASQVEAIEIAVRYKNKGNVVFQRHLYMSAGGRKILIIVGTTVGLWEAKDDATWSQLIDSVRLQ
ncbi:DcrB-related protein [Variovorax sp. EL159]|uniref:DcrB-related protein n=1 Tax=Variovorax sp. EL159 TaxID=1566270 RepID=UPI00088620AB|nr:DcrB-related protein [Variovorax sp. EL159]SCX59155.1 hypothetical protein SAMN03159363_2013 [Variovorax sp. EL159]